MVETISVAYEASDRLSLSTVGVRAHLTQSMEASKDFSLRVSLTDACDAASWSSPHKFVSFYILDLASSPGSQILMS